MPPPLSWWYSREVWVAEFPIKWITAADEFNSSAAKLPPVVEHETLVSFPGVVVGWDENDWDGNYLHVRSSGSMWRDFVFRVPERYVVLELTPTHAPVNNSLLLHG